MKVRFTEQQLADAFAEMPNGTSGFLREWGYVTYARALERIVNEPEMVTIGHRKIVAPLRKPPADGQPVYVACITCGKEDGFLWGREGMRFQDWLDAGLLFATAEQAEDAKQALLALLAPLPQQDKVPA